MGLPPIIEVTGIADADQATAELAVAFRDGGMTEREAIEQAQEIRDRFRAAFTDNAASGEDDPEMLPAPEKIRHAEQLIRREHRVLDDDWLFWGSLAGHLNEAANIPGLPASRPADWRRFSRAQDMATGIIRMSAAAKRSAAGVWARIEDGHPRWEIKNPRGDGCDFLCTDEVIRTYGRRHVEGHILRDLPSLPEAAWDVLR